MLSHDKDRMTRIGFTYNLKPEPEAMSNLHAEIDAGDEGEADEPPSWPAGEVDAVPGRGTELSARPTRTPPTTLGERSETQRPMDDEFAEWDDAETIDAVEHALSAL